MAPEAAASTPEQERTSAGRRLASGVARGVADGFAGALFRAFGHLLRQNDSARTRLAMFAGRRVRFGVDARGARAGPILTARVTEDGLLERLADGDEPADAEMFLRPSAGAAFALLRDGPRGLSSHLRLDGEVMLAAALGEVAAQLRWDVEEDLSRVTGDVVARRLGRGVESLRDAMRDVRSRLESSAGRYLARDTGQLVGRVQLDALRAGIDALHERLSRLEAPEAHGEAEAQARNATGPAPLPQLRPPLELPRLDFDPHGPGAAPREGESG